MLGYVNFIWKNVDQLESSGRSSIAKKSSVITSQYDESDPLSMKNIERYREYHSSDDEEDTLYEKRNSQRNLSSFRKGTIESKVTMKRHTEEIEIKNFPDNDNFKVNTQSVSNRSSGLTPYQFSDQEIQCLKKAKRFNEIERRFNEMRENVED